MGNILDALRKLDEKDDEYDGYDYDEDFFNYDNHSDKEYQQELMFSCRHEWVWYNSLFPHNSFQYCKICDEKK